VIQRPTFVQPLIACLLSVLVCLLYAGVRPHLSGWWRDHGGGVPYVIFWILLWFTVIPNRRWVMKICVAVVLATCFLEIFQLYDGPIWLQDFRRTRLGAAWLGHGFDWHDFPPYMIGGVCGWGLGRVVLRRSTSSQTSSSAADA